MGLQKPVSGGGFAAEGSGIQAVAVADVVDPQSLTVNPRLVQGPNNTVATPGRVFSDQLDDEFF
jgi:hypothetical protein